MHLQKEEARGVRTGATVGATNQPTNQPIIIALALGADFKNSPATPPCAASHSHATFSLRGHPAMDFPAAPGELARRLHMPRECRRQINAARGFSAWPGPKQRRRRPRLRRGQTREKCVC